MCDNNSLKSRKNSSCFLRAITAFLMLAVFFPLMPAQEKPIMRFSLSEAREYAVRHSFETAKSQIDLDAAGQKLKETLAIGLPQVSSTLSYNNNLKLATSLIPNIFEGKFDELIPVQFGTQHTANWGVTVQQLIFQGSYIVGLQTSGIYKKLAEQGLERSEMDIRETVTSTCHGILVLEENERILQKNMENIEKIRHEIEERFKEGFLAETDVDLIQISATRIANGLQAVRRQKKIAYKLLKFQMGIDLEEKIVLEENLENLLKPSLAFDASRIAIDLDHSVDFNLALTQEKLAGLALKNEKVKYLPTVSAFFTYEQSAYRNKFNFFNSDKQWFTHEILGVTISMPIFQSGGQKARVKQAALALDKARRSREQAAEALQMETDQVKSRLLTAQETLINMTANMKLASKVYLVTQEKFREGVSSSMELTQAHDQYLAAQSEYIKAVSELLSARNRLNRISNQYSH